MMDQETFRIKLENDQLKKRIKKLTVKYELLEKDYKELAKFAQDRRDIPG